jgi:hypothetical protein
MIIDKEEELEEFEELKEDWQTQNTGAAIGKR